MDAPRIQYAKTTDGVQIAFSTYGQGPPVFWLGSHPFAGSIQSFWREAWFDKLAQALAENHTVITYDPRGTGLSEREITWLTVEAQRLDLDAVLDKLGAQRLDIVSWGPYDVRLAVNYTVSTTRTIGRLVIIDGAPSDADFSRPTMEILAEILRRDWKLFTETLALLAFGWSGDDARRYAELVRAGVDEKMARRHLAFFGSFDVTALLSQIRVPALVIHHKGQRLVELDVSMAMASAIANAQLVTLEGSMGESSDALVAAVCSFLDAVKKREATTMLTGTPEVRTILFTDIEGHTAMMQRLGDAKGREVLREHERITREALRAHGGTEVKTIGDSFMASFPSAQKAVDCAIALQRAFAASDFAGERLRIRVGINAGEPIADADDLFGSSVILASRTKEKAAGGEIFVTDVVRQLVAGKGFLFANRGEVEMKGFEEPVRLYEVKWR